MLVYKGDRVSNLECLELNIFIKMVEILRNNDVNDIEITSN